MLHYNSIDPFVTLMGNFNWGSISRNKIISKQAGEQEVTKLPPSEKLQQIYKLNTLSVDFTILSNDCWKLITEILSDRSVSAISADTDLTVIVPAD